MVRTRYVPSRRAELTIPILAVMTLLTTACGEDSPVEPGGPSASVVATETLLITPVGLEFGTVQVGQTSAAQIVTVKNVTASPISMSGNAGTPGGGGFAVTQNCQGVTLAAGATCQMSYTFAPTSAGSPTATSSGTWNGQSYTIVLHGTGVGSQLLLTPTSLDFGEVAVGSTSVAQTVTLRNLGSAPMVLALVGGGTAAPFASTQACHGTTLNPGATCNISFTFAPTATGAAGTTVTGSWNGVPFEIHLAGQGIAAGSTPTQALRITPRGLEFGTVPLGTMSPAQLVTVTNVSGAGVTVTGTGGTPSAPFAMAQNCQGALLAPNASCQMLFSFMPTAAGGASGTATGIWNGQSYTIDLHGTGGAAGGNLLITPTGLDFGEIVVGTTSPGQVVTITNVGAGSVLMSGTLGVPSAPFGASQNCQGVTLNPGASCQMIFTFAPTSTGVFIATSSGTWNGVPFQIELSGVGVDAAASAFPYRFVEFLPPIGKRSKVNSGSNLPVKFVLRNSAGQVIPDADGQALASACRVRVGFEGEGAPGCASYDGGGRFSLNIKTSKSMTPGTRSLVVWFLENGTAVAIGTVQILIT